MRESDHGWLTPEGNLRFSRGAMEQLGIADKATCWGVWTQGKSRENHSSASLCALGRLDAEMLERFLELDRTDAVMAAEIRRKNAAATDQPDPTVNPNQQGPHLVISPLPPRHWTTAFRLEAMLEHTSQQDLASDLPEYDVPRIMADFVRELSRMGLVLYFTDAGMAGYDVMAFSAYCVWPEFDEILGRHLPPRPSEDASEFAWDDWRTRAFQAVGARLLPALSAIESRIRLLDMDGRRPRFVNHRIRDKGCNPYFCTPFDVAAASDELNGLEWRPFWDKVFSGVSFGEVTEKLWSSHVTMFEDKKRNVARRFSDRGPNSEALLAGEYAFPFWKRAQQHRMHFAHWAQGVSCRALNRLGYSALWRRRDAEPIRFTYHQRQSELRPASGADIFAQLEAFTGCTFLPHAHLLTSCHKVDKSLRVRFIRGSFAFSHMRVVEIKYSATATEKAELNSAGLLATVLETLLKLQGIVRVERVSDPFSSLAESSEVSTIRILIKASDLRTAKCFLDDHWIAALRRNVREAALDVARENNFMMRSLDVDLLPLAEIPAN